MNGGDMFGFLKAKTPGHPLDGGDPVTLIKQADTAMYASKGAGRNAYRFYTADMNASVQQRLQLETDMRRGLIGNEFFLVYQPQIDLRSGRTMGVEALDRAADRFEKWDPKIPSARAPAKPDPAANAPVAQDGATPASAPAAAAPAAPVEAEPAAGQRRLHAVRRGESKDA